MKGAARLRVGILLILILVALVSSLWAVWPWPTGDWKGFALNLGTEMIGALVTYGLLELFIGRRERREAKKADLIAELGSRVQDVARAAAEELRRHGWLYDGSLRGANLRLANLPKTDLSRADLQRAILFQANLQGARLDDSNLQGVELLHANLQGVNLSSANLQGADMAHANLQRATLHDTNLQGARLLGANLERVFWTTGAILPDGTKWAPGTDMARFTDFTHPDCWRPERYK